MLQCVFVEVLGVIFVYMNVKDICLDFFTVNRQRTCHEDR